MPAVERWREPTRALPLTWGHYADRCVIGLGLAIVGGLHVQGANTYALHPMLVGAIASIVGWSILPAQGWRRILAAALATGTTGALLAGPIAMWTFALAMLAWLVVRHRPLRSYVVLLFPLANGFILPRLFEDYRWMPLCLAISLGVVVASAWIARLIAVGVREPSRPTAPDR
jgi:hypothetical protein